MSGQPAWIGEPRGPCDCPPCAAGDEHRCVWLTLVGATEQDTKGNEEA